MLLLDWPENGVKEYLEKELDNYIEHYHHYFTHFNDKYANTPVNHALLTHALDRKIRKQNLIRCLAWYVLNISSNSTLTNVVLVADSARYWYRVRSATNGCK
jgi:hypothetical protein